MSSSLLRRRISHSWRPRTLTCNVRRLNTHFDPIPEANPPIRNLEEWTEMQLNRQEQKELIEYFSQFGSTQTRDTAWQPHHSLHRPPTPHSLTLSALLAAGAHLGHSTSLLNPNFIPYAYGARAGITIIDLDHTVPMLKRATNLVRAVAQRGGSVVFVGTRKNFRAAAQKAAERMGPQGFHVGDRWLPGTLTNRLELFGHSIVQTTKIEPDLVIFLNPIENTNAIRECAVHHIPTIGIIDSNVDPRIVMYAIPANDESQRTAEIIAGVLSIAGREGADLYKIFQEELDLKRRQSDERLQKRRESFERSREKGLTERLYHESEERL